MLFLSEKNSGIEQECKTVNYDILFSPFLHIHTLQIEIKFSTPRRFNKYKDNIYTFLFLPFHGLFSQNVENLPDESPEHEEKHTCYKQSFLFCKY